MINILDLIYPLVCGMCGRLSSDSLCIKCKMKLKEFEINKYLCNFNKNKYFDEIFHIYKYEGILRDKIIEYKFHNKPYIYKTFAKIILKNKKTCGFLQKYDIIIPVPIHNRKRQQRGYNQTELIAKELSKNTKLKLEKDVLIKVIDNKHQSSLSKKDRKENIKGAFKIHESQKIIDKNILIFDDIYTTGNTVNECSKVLRQSGIRNIGVLTIAKDYKK